jgi:excisionase family DNA binding protein
MSALFETNNLASGEKLLPVKQSAAMLGVSPRTVWRMIADGQLTPVRFRRCTRVAVSQLMVYLKGGNKVGCL